MALIDQRLALAVVLAVVTGCGAAPDAPVAKEVPSNTEGPTADTGSATPEDDAAVAETDVPDTAAPDSPDTAVPETDAEPPGEPEPSTSCVRTIPVATTAALGKATDGAKPGDCIVLADGDYTFASIVAKGTAKSPIVIRAEHVGKATVSHGNLQLQGAAYVTISGLSWTSSAPITFVDTDHCRLTRSRIAPKEATGFDWVTVSGKSDSTRIDHDDFGPRTMIGNIIMLAGVGSQIVQHTRIDHNYFHDVHRTTGNGWETIRAGLSGLALSSGFTTIEYNLFENCDGDPETISIKSSDNVIRYNTLRHNAGELTLRHGNRTAVYANYILGAGESSAGGIRVCGEQHQIFDNYIQDIPGAGIFLESGDSDVRNEAGTAHYRVHDAQVVNNTVVSGPGISVGGAHEYAPVDCTIANNLVQNTSGAAISESGMPTGTVYLGNMVHPVMSGTVGVSRPAGEIRSVDPKLVAAGEIFRIGPASPAVDASLGSFPYVTFDIDGQPRVKPDVGADEVSTGPEHGPLTKADVGPSAP